jgi:hypothetical protein
MSCVRFTMLVVLSIHASVVTGCAHASPRPRTARALMIAGTAAVIVGGVAATGCVDDAGNGACTGDPGAADLAVGLPVLTAGIVMLISGIVLSGRMPTPSSVPAPVMPDPFVPPLADPSR